jgi:purine-binding chemotaxis protein CheW
MADPAASPAGPAAGVRRFLTFWVGEQLYGLPAEDVSEVIRVPPVARVPQGPRSLIGLGNLRGAVLPIASARSLLGQAQTTPTRAIVLAGEAPVALAVDSVDSLVSVDATGVQTEQAALVGEPGERLVGVFQVSGRRADVVKVLDVWPLLEADFKPTPRAAGRAATAVAHDLSSDAASPEGGHVRRLVTFDAAGQEFALSLDEVQEIVQLPPSVMAVPRAEALVLGVASYRDALLPLLSLRGLVGLPPASTTVGREKVLVVRAGNALAGVVVDAMRTIVPADPALVEPTPPMLAARTGGESQIIAIYRGDGGRRLISILSTDKLFREDVMQRLRQAAPPQTAFGERVEDATAELQFVVFRLGDDEFALPIDAVEEVARAPDEVTRIPKTPKFLDGVINLRGEVLPVVDQRRRFDMPPAPDREARRLLVVRTQRHRAGLIVDSVSEVLRSTADSIEPAPHLTAEANCLVHSVINLERAGRLILVLDPAELLTRAERGLLDAFKGDARQAAS